jgi:hypothetical protein
MEFHTGEGVTPGGVVRRINIIDSIGFCDSHLDPIEVDRIIKEAIKGNCLKIHKVLVVVSGRLQKEHQDSIKQILSWLGYDPKATRGPSFSESVFFIYTKCDGQTEEKKQQNLLRVCDLLGAESSNTMGFKSPDGTTHFVQNALAVGFPPQASFDAIKDDYDKLMFATFDIPTAPPIAMRKSMCTIL